MLEITRAGLRSPSDRLPVVPWGESAVDKCISRASGGGACSSAAQVNLLNKCGSCRGVLQPQARAQQDGEYDHDHRAELGAEAHHPHVAPGSATAGTCGRRRHVPRFKVRACRRRRRGIPAGSDT